MIRGRLIAWIAASLGLVALMQGEGGRAGGENSPAARPAAAPGKPEGGAYRAKMVVELPTKVVMQKKSAPLPSATAEFKNPKVQPGKIHWRATFAEACAAARKSGRPVLLFQMMGKLDDQFC
jgi:hypothetical protein